MYLLACVRRVLLVLRRLRFYLGRARACLFFEARALRVSTSELLGFHDGRHLTRVWGEVASVRALNGLCVLVGRLVFPLYRPGVKTLSARLFFLGAGFPDMVIRLRGAYVFYG